MKKNVSYGSEDAALWVEASENVRVIGNDISGSPTGLEVTVSKNIQIKKNDVHDNTVGMGLYHPPERPRCRRWAATATGRS